MVIMDISKFLHCLIKGFLCPELIQIRAFIFQSVEISFHRRVVIRASRLTHALRHMDGFTKFHKRLGCILRALIAVERQISLDCRLRIQGFLQRADRQIAGDPAVGNAGDHAPVMQIYNGANVAPSV